MTTTDESILKEFLAEALDHLDGIEDSLLQIEGDGANINEELVNKVFRAVHTIKGGAGFLNLQKISQVCHAQENILNLVRNRKLVPTNPVTTTLLITLDTIKGLLLDISLEAAADVSTELARLNTILAAAEAGMNESQMASNSGPGGAPAERPLKDSVSDDQLDSWRRKGFWVFEFKIDFSDPKSYGYMTGDSLLSVMEKTGTIIASSMPINDLKVRLGKGTFEDVPVDLLYASILEPDLIRQMLRLPVTDIHQVVSQDSKASTPAPAPVPKAGMVSTIPSPTVSSPIVVSIPVPPPGEVAQHAVAAEPADKIKVSLSVIDNLMSLAGELVLARNQLIQSVSSKDIEAIDRSARQLNFITSELQMNIMSTRMQPVGNVFNKFRRIVRDMGQKLGKHVQILISGEEVELDKNIIEAIGDPLTHIVRNSMDHGIETVETREAIGKAAMATIQLVARHEAGMVVLEVSDDGAGIDAARVKRKAIEKSVVTAQAAEMMTEKEILNLVFLPGFSTADKVTDISGRGVGMDVVRTTFAKLGGSVDIVSVFGKGTTLQIRLPLTLAIIPALMVKVADMVFAVPQVNLQELVRVAPDQVKKRINRVGDAVFLRLRDELLPLLSIREILKVKSYFTDPITGEEREDKRQFWDRRKTDEEVSEEIRNLRQKTGDRRSRMGGSVKIAVVTTGHIRFGIVVDGFQDTEEVVLKPLGSHIKECRFYSGATILGDGRPALIFDISGVAEHWLNIATLQDARESISSKQTTKEDVQALIILKGGGEQFYAAPLGLITRIEQVDAKQIEKVGGKVHMQYRNAIMPLYTVDGIAKVEALPEQDFYYVVLFKMQKKDVGLIVAEIVDTVETKAIVDQSAYHQNGIMGTSIIDGRTTFMLDLYGIAVGQNPELGHTPVVAQVAGSVETKVLVVDDSLFFRTQIQKFVEEAGFKTLTAEDGVQALEMMKDSANVISMLLTDIEMPNMDGLELTRHVRDLPQFKNLPILAITSLMGSDAEKRGLEAGVNEYQIKLDREKIVDRLRFYHKVK
jgi:two-component system chemotaxis sensor kinase CheA